MLRPIGKGVARRQQAKLLNRQRSANDDASDIRDRDFTPPVVDVTFRYAEQAATFPIPRQALRRQEIVRAWWS